MMPIKMKSVVVIIIIAYSSPLTKQHFVYLKYLHKTHMIRKIYGIPLKTMKFNTNHHISAKFNKI